jgi:hypothetical protein
MCEVSKSSVFNILKEDFDMMSCRPVQGGCRDSLISDDRKKEECRQVKLFCVTKKRQTGACGFHMDSKYADNFGMQICIVLIFTNLMYYGQY